VQVVGWVLFQKVLRVGSCRAGEGQRRATVSEMAASGSAVDEGSDGEFMGEYPDAEVADFTGDVLEELGTGPMFDEKETWGGGMKEAVLMNCRLKGTLQFKFADVASGLVRLCLRQNFLEALSPEVLANLSQLQRLELRDNQLEQIPEMSLPELRVLDLSYNGIRVIDNLEGLPKLRELFLCQNKIADIGAGIQGVRGTLRELELGGNRIRRIENLDGFDRLETLWLGKNKIVDAAGIPALPRLTKLDLQGNRFTDLSGFEPVAHQLRELLISSNGLTSLTGIHIFAELTLLDVSANKIGSLANSQLDHLRNLEEFWCTSNQLSDYKELETELGNNLKLVSVMLEANPLARDTQYRNKMQAALPRLQQLDCVDIVRTSLSRLLSGESEA
jgi:protein phosphatase 1 regulatory subunit 7